MAQTPLPIGTSDATLSWLQDAQHRAFLVQDAQRQLAFFRPSLRADGGFDVLDLDGTPLPGQPQELHTTTRLVHSYAMGHAMGAADCLPVVEAGMAFLWDRHRDAKHGGYVWSLAEDAIADDQKLAYGHVFVLLAASSAKAVGHADADRLIADVTDVLERRFWDDEAGLLQDEFARDWTPFSTYRGYNANMHGCEAFLAAYEATGEATYLNKAGRILDFFVGQIAPQYDWRLPEHFTETWQPDLQYQGNPMFRPRGTTPGHSFELGRLALQHWDLAGRTDAARPGQARKLIETALSDAWRPAGGFAYTLDYDGQVQIADRYWWPVTEAIGALAALIKLGATPEDEAWYRKLWAVASELFIDHARGGWYPEIGADNAPVGQQFIGKPDIYHALQADLFPLLPGLSGAMEELADLADLADPARARV